MKPLRRRIIPPSIPPPIRIRAVCPKCGQSFGSQYGWVTCPECTTEFAHFREEQTVTSATAVPSHAPPPIPPLDPPQKIRFFNFWVIGTVVFCVATVAVLIGVLSIGQNPAKNGKAFGDPRKWSLSDLTAYLHGKGVKFETCPTGTDNEIFFYKDNAYLRKQSLKDRQKRLQISTLLLPRYGSDSIWDGIIRVEECHNAQSKVATINAFAFAWRHFIFVGDLKFYEEICPKLDQVTGNERFYYRQKEIREINAALREMFPD
jgi:hypothetical protein